MESMPRQSGEVEDIAKLLVRFHDLKQRAESLLLENHELRRQAALTAGVTAAIIASLGVGNWRDASATLLRHALNLTQSEYGFIGFVLTPGRLRILAHEGVLWDQVTSTNREFYENTLNAYTEVGYLEFSRLDNLFGRVISSGNTILSNDAAHDLLSSGRFPPGHPPLRQFLGVPAKYQGEVVGMIGIANRDGGYREYDQRHVEALATILGALHASYGRHLRVSELEEQLRVSQARLVEVFEQREVQGRDRRAVAGTVCQSAQRGQVYSVGSSSSYL